VADLAELRLVLDARPALREVMAVAAILIDGQTANDDARLAEGAVVDILPPFAGGSI